MLCLSFYEWRCIDAGEQMLLAPCLGKTSRDRAPGRFADLLFAPKHEKADVLLTTNMGPVRGWSTSRCDEDPEMPCPWAPIPCTHLCPETEKDSCPIVSNTTHVTFANDRLSSSVSLAANDDSVSLAKSRAHRTALSRRNEPLRVQPEIFRGTSGFKPSSAYFLRPFGISLHSS